jgi:ketosteroid isomerase-like protein
VVRALTALAALWALGLSACGGNDKDEVDTTVRDFVTATNARDANKFCDHLASQQFLEQSTGAKGGKARDACHQQMKSLKSLKLKLQKISSTKVDGDNARVRTVLLVQGQTQDQVFRLRKEGGDWKLAGGAGG